MAAWNLTRKVLSFTVDTTAAGVSLKSKQSLEMC
jgi:hypothetical protein